MAYSAADAPFGADPSPTQAAPTPAAAGPGDQTFDMGGGGGNASAPTPSAAAPTPSAGANDDSYYASLASGYAERAKAEDAVRAALIPKPPAAKPPPHQDAGFVANFQAPAKQAWQQLKTDVQGIAQAKSPDQMPSTGAVLGDVGNLVVSPVAGAFNAAVLQPGSDVLDKLPAPQQVTGDVVHGYKFGGPMTPEQQHAANENAINKALMAVGPKGVKFGGGLTPSLGAVADANDAAAIARATKTATQYSGKVAQVVNAVPAEVALDTAGQLTPEGHEYATQAGVHPEDLKTGYQATQETQAAHARAIQAHDAAMRAHEEAQAAVDHAAQQAPGTQEAADAHQAAADKQSAADQAFAAAEQATDEALGRTTSGPEEPQAQVAPELQGMAQPALEAAAAPEAVPGVPDESKWQEPDANAPTTAAGRVAEAASEGVDLSKGEATQDFETQARENDLKGTNGNAQSWVAQRAQQIQGAVNRFRQTFGDPNLTAADRGQVVQDALRGLLDSGKAGVSAFYDQARALAQSLGEQHQGLLDLDTGHLLRAMREILVDEGTDASVRDAVRQQAAKYGLIGENPKTVEGITTVDLRDTEGNLSGKQQFVGPREPLTVMNAEDLRQKINALYAKDSTGSAQSLKALIDQAVKAAIGRAAEATAGTDGTAAQIVDNLQQGRAAHAALKQTFNAKDIVDDLVSWKKGTEIREGGKVVDGTSKVLPEDAIRKIVDGGESNLKRIKLVLLSNPTEASKAAWDAIRSHAIGQIFDKATTTNANLGGGQVGAISGAKLNTALNQFGTAKLKILLTDSEFNQLMKLRRITENATVPISGTTNSSGSGHLLARFMKNFGGHVWKFASQEIPVVGYPMKVLGGVAEAATQKAAERETLKGITGFDAKAAAAADAGK